MNLESLLGAAWRTIVVGQSKVGPLGQNRVGANSQHRLEPVLHQFESTENVAFYRHILTSADILDKI
jgi:hypothetical protein